jgi:DNA-binding transcriptional LysR family regulator
MKLQHLRFLTAVVDYGGVIKAADRLYLSQPTITAGLKALENDLGKPIFNRSNQANRPLTLTPAGQRFYQNAIEILKQCDLARENFLGADSEKTSLRIGFLDTLPQRAISELLGQLFEINSNLNIEVWEGTSERIEKWFIQKRIDIAWKNIHDLIPNSLTLWREPLVAVVSPKLELSVKNINEISIRDFSNIPLIHRSRCELDNVGRAQLKSAGVKLKVKVRAEREDFAFQLVRDLQGFTMSPQSLVPNDLTIIKLTDLNVIRNIGIQWQSDIDSMLLSAFIQSVQISSQQFQI